MEKKVFMLTGMIVFALLFTISFISAINLEVSAKPVVDTVITELRQPAVFNFTIKNKGDSDNFLIYSIVAVDISPNKTSFIGSGDTQSVLVTVMPTDTVISRRSSYAFEYLIKDSKGEIQSGKLTIGVVDLSDAIGVSVSDIDPTSTNATITVKNNVMNSFDNLTIEVSSPLADGSSEVSLNSFDTKSFTVPVERDKIKFLSSGNYSGTVQISTDGKTASKQIPIKFIEQKNIKTTESNSGIIIQTYEVKKENFGNVNEDVSVNEQRGIISYLFTTFNVQPSQTVMSGFSVTYTWNKNLLPGEVLDISMKTNWWYPLIIIIVIVVIVYLVVYFKEPDLSLRKSVSFVHTKGGEFALKITVKAKAKKNIDNIKVIDTIPQLVNLYGKYGAITPDKVEGRRIEWDVSSMSAGEEKIFSYIVYSKVGVVGKFELPHARATYELKGKAKHIFSNRAIFMGE